MVAATALPALFDQKEGVLGGALALCAYMRKNAAFHISDEMVEAISEKSSRKKVTAKLPEQQKL